MLFDPRIGTRIFIRAMRENGIGDREIRVMVDENPGKMLGIEIR